VLNNAGEAAFWAEMSGTSGGSGDDTGFFRGSGGTPVQIVREDQPAPDGNGVFDHLGAYGSSTKLAINDAGETVFLGRLRDTSGGALDDSGLFQRDSGPIKQIAREGQSAPDGNGEFDEMVLSGFGLGPPATLSVNNRGTVAFSARLRDTNGGTSDDDALFLGDGQELITAVREGQSLAGSAIAGLVGLSVDHGGRSVFNDLGQLAFAATLDNGQEGVFLFTPELHWRTAGSGNWDERTNWTVSIDPAHVHPVVIDPITALVITGPSEDLTVRSLAIGDSGNVGQPALRLQADSTLTATDGITLESNAKLVFEIGGSAAGELARLTTNGVADALMLDGTLDVSLIDPTGGNNPFQPALGDVFEIIAASGGVDGTFTTQAEELPSLSAGLGWSIDYGANNVVLSVVPSLPGDFNLDGTVDAADYAHWRKNDGTQAAYDTWRAHFGQTAGTGTSTSGTAAPEPASFAFILLALLGLRFAPRGREVVKNRC
jgi:hypothetical protein